MKRSARAVVGGICLGTLMYCAFRWYHGLRRIRTLRLTNKDLDYSEKSSEELVSQHLLDLNTASSEQIAALGMSAEAVERVLENRPYRNKLDLVSRMVFSQAEYSVIRDRVSVADAREAVKIA